MTRYAFKVSIIGDGGVGKTSLRRQFMGQSFIANHLATIGADFSSEKIEIEDDIVEFQIWDLAGQPNFKSIRSRFYSGTKGALCVFDLTNENSFDNLPLWIEELFKNSGTGTIPIILLGNKVDLNEDRTIDHNQVMEFVDDLNTNLDYNINYLETSAKTGENVDYAFNTIATQLRDTAIAQKIQDS